MLKTVLKGGTYRNKKTGNLYYVLSLAKHSETQEELVVYVRREMDDFPQVWVRPLELFKEKFEI